MSLYGIVFFLRRNNMENKVLATVNGTEITENDLNLTISKFPKERQGYLSTVEGKKQLLQQVISFELMYKYALDNGLEKEPMYLAQLDAFKKEMLTQTSISKILSGIVVTEEDAKKYYSDNEAQFLQNENVNASHILVKTLEEATDVKAKLAEGMTFEEAATKYSTCPSKENGGNLGSFSKGMMVPEFEKSAFELPIGVVSEPVKTQFGYHIIKVQSRDAARALSFEEVKDSILQQLKQQKETEKYVSFTKDLEKKYPVKIK